MRIQSFSMQTGVSHALQRAEKKHQSIDMWVGPRSAPESVKPATAANASAPTASSNANSTAEPSAVVQFSPKETLMMEIVRRLIKAMTGRDWQLLLPDKLQGKIEGVGAQAASTSASSNTAASPPAAGFGLIVQSQTRIEESENMTYQAQGQVKTEDGREIPFNLQLTMSRAFVEEREDTLRMGDALRKVDPLVINLAGKGAALRSDARFQFDLNADGKTESLSELSGGSGFLALDKNGDGQVNDGTELFGAVTGNGFTELAGYDETHDGLIDENDSIFKQLRVWQRDGGGDGKLLGLGAVGVGAIAVGNVSTPFQLTDPSNQGLGQVRSTGVFLKEDGGIGSVQQIDYLV